jgi:hypothetical protein
MVRLATIRFSVGNNEAVWRTEEIHLIHGAVYPNCIFVLAAEIRQLVHDLNDNIVDYIY